ncbi:hypothetical protein Acsp03_66750 [Actinomadura sp. NBRC 104412]|uniref:hypothetical protein n=1 Tax=Actinomadura sp. NBRC 104412 TaxID=3032203 RepID=UPI0024A04DEE|nr:hypothetical protein [Actinomadura sp. NBRC 104412]GLZ09209.1 hypothetical protein Acsp03_66750 [Actinomadura sp. NBRC 104412]
MHVYPHETIDPVRNADERGETVSNAKGSTGGPQILGFRQIPDGRSDYTPTLDDVHAPAVRHKTVDLDRSEAIARTQSTPDDSPAHAGVVVYWSPLR